MVYFELGRTPLYINSAYYDHHGYIDTNYILTSFQKRNKPSAI
jgi:hypothetical protein